MGHWPLLEEEEPLEEEEELEEELDEEELLLEEEEDPPELEEDEELDDELDVVGQLPLFSRVDKKSVVLLLYLNIATSGLSSPLKSSGTNESLNKPREIL